MSDLSCSDYSEKAIVVRGEDTRTYLEDLKKLGGKFNRNLKDGAGWIFSKKNKDKVNEFIKSLKSNNKGKVLKYSSVGLMENIETSFKTMNYKERLEFISNITELAKRVPLNEKKAVADVRKKKSSTSSSSSDENQDEVVVEEEESSSSEEE